MKNYVNYDEKTGIMRWIKRNPSDFKEGKISAEMICHRWNSKWEGRPAFDYINPDGYKKGSFGGKSLQAHRVAWELTFGKIPEGMQIDHINGNRSDNRITNLRLVTQIGNSRNMKMLSTNTSGVTGVTLGKKMKKWRARISGSNGQRIHLGYFHTKEEALASMHPLRSLPENNYTSRHGKHEAEEDFDPQVVA